MKKALIYSLSLALLLVVVLVACNKPQADRSTEPQEPDPAASMSAPADVSTPEPVKDSTPEPTANTTPEPEPEQTPPALTENEDAQPPEDTTPQEPAQEQTAEPSKETKPTTQSSGGSSSTTQTKPQGQQGQQGQTQQQGQQTQQPTGDTSGRPADFDDQLKQILDNNYTPDYSKGPLTADEKAGIADAISGRGGQTQGNPSGKTPEQVKAEEEATQKALDDMLNDWLSGN